jgi:hypothetical protein
MNETALLILHGAILLQALPKVEWAYLDAIARKIEEPTILVLDLLDERARALAQLELDAGMIEGMLARGKQLGKRPRLLFAQPRLVAGPLVATLYPETGSTIAEYIGANYMAVVIASSGGQIFELPTPLSGGELGS